jgi:hypothetical protein
MTEQKAKIRKSFNALIRAAIILVTYGFIYRQVFVTGKLDDIPGAFNRIMEKEHTLPVIIIVVALMLVNWGFEAVKWRVLIRKIENVSFFRSIQAVMAGVSVSLFTPNRTGDYLGRVFILEKANHIEGILITLIGSFAQTAITLGIGLFCLLSFFSHYLADYFSLHEYLLTSLIFLVPCIVFVMLLLYFNVRILTDIINKYLPGKWEKYLAYSRVFSRFKSRELFNVILISLFRYMIFSTQYYLLLWIFGAEVPVSQAMILIPVIYLVMALVPSVALVDLGIRGSVAIFILGFYFNRAGTAGPDANLAILAASSLLWLINLIIPAIIGTFFVFSLKFFRK